MTPDTATAAISLGSVVMLIWWAFLAPTFNR
jgi:hypothetical protein